MSNNVWVREVGTRDGLQSIDTIFTTDSKIEWIKQEAAAVNIIWTSMISTDNTGGATTDLPAIKAVQYLGNADDAGNFAVNGIIDTTAHTTYTDVYARIKHDNALSQNFKLHFGQLTVYRVG